VRYVGETNQGDLSDFGGNPSIPLQKFFAELFFKKATTPRPQAHTISKFPSPLAI